jgi:hypothetical protein
MVIFIVRRNYFSRGYIKDKYKYGKYGVNEGDGTYMGKMALVGTLVESYKT